MSIRPGQMFTTDMLVSAFVFIILLNVSYMAINEAYSQQDSFSQERILQQQSSYLANLLVRTPGYPDGWTAETVEILGVADPDHVLQNAKIEEMYGMNYSQQKDAMDLSQHEFYLTIKADGKTVWMNRSEDRVLGEEPVAFITDERLDQTVMWRALNTSSQQWSLYLPDTSGIDQPLSADHVYNYTDDTAAMYEDMIDNASNGAYRTVIAEEPDVREDDLANADLLGTFVSDGNTYIHTENPRDLLEQVFEVSRSSSGSNEGEVIRTGPILNDSYAVGDTMTFDSNYDGFSDPETAYVNETDTPYACLVCRWDHGNGDIYFLMDSIEDAGNPGPANTFTAADKVFGGNFSLEFGKTPVNTTSMTASQRSVLVNTSNRIERGKLRLVLWQ